LYKTTLDPIALNQERMQREFFYRQRVSGGCFEGVERKLHSPLIPTITLWST